MSIAIFSTSIRIIIFTGIATIIIIIIIKIVVKSHLLRMVVVALPLTHQNGPSRGILRAHPSL